jgi:hypothetical protein
MTLHLQSEMGCCLAPKCDFSAIHLKNAWIATGRTAGSRYGRAGEKPEFHETNGKLIRQIDPVDDSRFAFPEVGEPARRPRPSPGLDRRSRLIETELHFTSV